MPKIISSAQKLGMASIADTVFNLDDSYKGILHILAKHGGQYIWNMIKLSKIEHTTWELDQRLRANHGFQGCIYGPDGTCPAGFPCQGCAGVPAPCVVAQLELTAPMSNG